MTFEWRRFADRLKRFRALLPALSVSLAVHGKWAPRLCSCCLRGLLECKDYPEEIRLSCLRLGVIAKHCYR